MRVVVAVVAALAVAGSAAKPIARGATAKAADAPSAPRRNCRRVEIIGVKTPWEPDSVSPGRDAVAYSRLAHILPVVTPLRPRS